MLAVNNTAESTVYFGKGLANKSMYKFLTQFYGFSIKWNQLSVMLFTNALRITDLFR